MLCISLGMYGLRTIKRGRDAHADMAMRVLI